MTVLDKDKIITVIERNIGRMGDDAGYERIAEEVVAMASGWISIHDQYPPENPVNSANSVQVLWCDSEDSIPEYASVFRYPSKIGYIKHDGFFDGGGSSSYVFDFKGCKRDLYWKYLDPLPNPVKR
jgi:hypothetical protein